MRSNPMNPARPGNYAASSMLNGGAVDRDRDKKWRRCDEVQVACHLVPSGKRLRIGWSLRDAVCGELTVASSKCVEARWRDYVCNRSRLDIVNVLLAAVGERDYLLKWERLQSARLVLRWCVLVGVERGAAGRPATSVSDSRSR